jgi:hypothetical protein
MVLGLLNAAKRRDSPQNAALCNALAKCCESPLNAANRRDLQRGRKRATFFWWPVTEGLCHFFQGEGQEWFSDYDSR